MTNEYSCQSAQTNLNTIKAAYLELKQNLSAILSSPNLTHRQYLNQFQPLMININQLQGAIDLLFKELGSELEQLLNLRQQYTEQIKILKNAGILKELANGTLGIVDILGNQVAVPTYREVVKRFKDRAEELRIKSQESSGEPLLLETKVKQGFTKLLLVPFGMPLGTSTLDPHDPNQKRYIYTGLFKIYADLLVKHSREGKLFRTKQDPYATDEKEAPIPIEVSNTEQPLLMSEDYYNDADINGNIVYHLEQFNPIHHQGQTKTKILHSDSSDAWQVLLVEDLLNLPTPETAQTINGRTQLDNEGTAIKKYIKFGQTIPNPAEYLQAIQQEPMYQHEQGFTPEDWLILAITYLEAMNQVIDDWQGNGKGSWLLGAYHEFFSYVPVGLWYSEHSQSILGGTDADDRFADFVMRVAVHLG